MPETTPLIKAALNLRGGAGFDVYLLELSQRGLNAEEVYEGRFPNTIYCYVYRVVR